jgi:ABC-type Mn2+/Zn2+ transport system ATPase subunit
LSACDKGSKEKLITIQSLWLGYGKQVVLKDVEACICSGEFVGLVGPNGSGKTTFLKALLGILKPIRGSIIWHVPRESVRFGYVPQRELLDELYPLSAIDIVLMSRLQRKHFLKRMTKEDVDVAMWALEQVGIADMANQPYRLLSGGQRQKVLIARALAVEPNILILDEPTNGLDLPTEHSIMELIARLHSELSITVIFVTHLLNLVINFANKLCIFHDGRVYVGETSEMVSPERLKEAYGVETVVATVNGRKLIFVRQ